MEKIKFSKSFDLIYNKNNEDPYYFEGIASTYKNIDKFGDQFLDGALDGEIGKTVAILNNHKKNIEEALIEKNENHDRLCQLFLDLA